MANEQNLVPFTSDQNREEAAKNGHKGGIASGKARRERKDRHERIKELFAMAIKDPKIKENLKKMGVDAVDLETAADARVMVEILKKGDYKAWQAMKDEAYGKLDSKTSLEVSGEVSGITINIKDYSKGEK